MTLARLAALHGVATEYAPSEGVTVTVPEATVVAVLRALDVDASTPRALAAALGAAERAARDRLLPPAVVRWRAEPKERREPTDPRDPRDPKKPPWPGEPGDGGHGDDESDGGDGGGGGGGHGGDAGDARITPGPSGPYALRLPSGTRITVTTEDGRTVTGRNWRGLPLGVHRLTAQAPDGRTATAALIVAPARVPAPPGRSYGLLVQLYSLLSARSWGMGDLGDLSELADWAARTHGAGFVQVNPLHAAVPGAPADPSPYRPSSRRFPDPVHLRIEDVPEFGYVAPARQGELERILADAAELRERVLGKGALIDRDAVWDVKRRALELIHTVELGPGRRAAYHDFLAEHGRALEDHATYQALAERHGPHWRRWPDGLRDPRRAEAAVRADAALAERADFHCRLAWLTDQQLAAAAATARDAGMPVGIVHDLAVGVHPDGSDAWAQQHVFAAGMSVGAPPDAFNARGQDWGLPPWRPDALAAEGYAPYRGLLRALLRHAGALRIDHVMGLFRLWWVPEGGTPDQGTYVRYDAEAMLAVLALEAHRAGAAVVGEDLGTVEPGVREELARRGVLGTSVLWFERDWAGAGAGGIAGRPLRPEEWRADCVATVTTHDLPPTAARLTGSHVALRHRLGLAGGDVARERVRDAAETAEWLGLLTRLGYLPEGPGDEAAEIRAFHRFLAATPARLVGVWLPDAVGDRRPQNLPGTWDAYPNWRLPLADPEGQPLTLEELASSLRAHDLLRGLAERFGAHTAPPGARPV
ncbi:4-alpha-glucanotransferase [Streptomyces laurentii]|uniref:4-alpha-glucanotransferase n=1 Tax=Streptomyces laurentii TaxID=39478 RepID=A0A160NWY5_STRLU|nr:4-alpha-glucanotransferase [Streptomyces laurentii]